MIAADLYLQTNDFVCFEFNIHNKLLFCTGSIITHYPTYLKSAAQFVALYCWNWPELEYKSILVPNCAGLEFPLFNVYNHSLGAPFLSCAAIAHYYTQPLTVDIQSDVLSSFIY